MPPEFNPTILVNSAGLATDNAVPRFDGVGGSLVKNGLVSVSGAGVLERPGDSTFEFSSTRVSGAGNASVQVTADVNAAAIDPAHKLLVLGWRDDVDAFTEVFAFQANGVITGDVPGVGNTLLFDATDQSTGLGSTSGVLTSNAGDELLLLHQGRTDAASAVVIASVYDRGAAAITNAGSMRIHSFGWVDDANAYTELAYVRADGRIWGGSFSTPGTIAATSNISSTSSFVDGLGTRIQGNTDFNTGQGTVCAVYPALDQTLILRNHLRTDGASNVVFASVYDRNAASITNAATMRLHSFGWTNNSDAYTELAYVRADGHLWLASGVTAGNASIFPTIYNTGSGYWFSSSGYGLARSGYTTGLTQGTTVVEGGTTNTLLLLQRGMTDAASAVVAATVYDVDAASIANAGTMRIHSFGWTNNSDVYTEVAAVYASGAFVATGSIFGASIGLGGNKIVVGQLATGSPNLMGTGVDTYGLVNTDTGEAVGISSVRADGSGNVSFALTADVNNATINAAHEILSIGWTDNADSFTQTAAFLGNGNLSCTGIMTPTGGVSTGAGVIGLNFNNSNSRFILQYGNLSTGIQGTSATTLRARCDQADNAGMLLSQFRGDAADNVCWATVYDRNAASITNAATMRLHSFGWTNNVDAYTEVASIRANGTIYTTGSLLADGSAELGNYLTVENGMIAMANTDYAGFGAVAHYRVNDAGEAVFLHSARTDGAGNRVFTSVYDRNAASITNASTMRLHSFGWTNNADAYTEVAAIYADGHFQADGYITSSTFVSATTYVNGLTYIKAGTSGNGIFLSADAVGVTGRQLYTDNVAHTLQVRSSYASGAGNLGITLDADVNAAAIDGTHKIASFGWINDSDVRAEVASVQGDGTFFAAAVKSTGAVWADALNMRFYYTGDITGLGAAQLVRTDRDTPSILLKTGRTDGVDNVCWATVYDRNAASITNAATMRIHSFGWTNDSDVYAEVAAVYADGAYKSDYAHAIGSTPTEGKGSIVLRNTTAAVLDAQQWSPGIYLAGQGWETGVGSSDEAIWRILNVPAQGASITSTLYFSISLNGGGYTTGLTVGPTGITAPSFYTSGTVSASYYASGTNFWFYGNADLNLASTGGLDGVTDNIWSGADRPIVLVQTNAARDASGAIIFASVFDRNAASITNASTLKIHSFGWTNDSDVYTELAYVRADGTTWALGISFASAYYAGGGAAVMQRGDFSTGLSYGGGFISDAAGDSLQLINRKQTDAASEVVIASIYDIGTASITNAATMKLHSFGWTNNVDAYTELAAVYADGKLAIHSDLWFPSGGNIGQAGSDRPGNAWFTGSLKVHTGTFSLLEFATLHTYTALGAVGALSMGDTTGILGIRSGRTDGASNVCIASVYDRNAASITNAATMRIHSFGWADNADAYVELASVRGNGDFYAALTINATGNLTWSSSNGQLTALASGASNLMGTDVIVYGMQNTNTGRTLGIRSVMGDGAGNVGFSLSADVNNATINAAYVIAQFGWTDNVDAYTAAAYLLGNGTLHAAADPRSPPDASIRRAW